MSFSQELASIPDARQPHSLLHAESEVIRCAKRFAHSGDRPDRTQGPGFGIGIRDSGFESSRRPELSGHVRPSTVVRAIERSCLEPERRQRMRETPGTGLHAIRRIPNPESRIPNPESRIPNPESRAMIAHAPSAPGSAGRSRCCALGVRAVLSAHRSLSPDLVRSQRPTTWIRRTDRRPRQPRDLAGWHSRGGRRHRRCARNP